MEDENMIICKRGDRGAMVKRVQRLLHLMPDGIFGNLTEEAVKELQRTNDLKVDGVVGLRTWSVLLGFTLLPKSSRVITEIIVHCTATKAGQDYTVDDIRRWHKQQGWSDIGYHYVVYRDGSIHKGRPVDMIGAHCSGHNTHSIGVVYIGGLGRDGIMPRDTRTVAQAEGLRRLIMELRRLYPNASIFGHRDFAPKACPCFDARNEYKDL